MAINDTLISAKQKTFRFFKRILIFFLVLISLGLVLTFLLTKFNYSEGDRAGTVSKFSTKGYVFKTHEGDLNVGAMGEVGNVSTNIWSFTVEDGNKEIIKKIGDAMVSGKRVKLHYKQRYLKFFWMGETEYFISSIEESPL
ncbi:MAG: hypothetical protein KA313_05155 [Pseudarcicella sp.]|jgi:hypothetical protein|nr:hypothetical protein [Pseudarcicella sp.]